MENKLGIDNIKKMLALGFQFGNQYEVAMEDGKFTTTDAFGFLDELMQIPAVAQNGKVTLEEALDVTEEEKTELHKWAKETFNLKDDEVEEKVEAVLNWVIGNLVLYKVFAKKKQVAPAAPGKPQPGKI